MVPVAGQQARRTWEVQAARGEVGGARLQHPKLVVQVATMMIQATGLAIIAPLLIPSRPSSVRCASNADKPHFPMIIDLPGIPGRRL